MMSAQAMEVEPGGGGGGFHPIQEGNSLLIRGFPSGPKPYEEVLTFLRKGNMLQKYGRHGNPKYHHFRLGAGDAELQWVSKGGRVRRVPLTWMKRFQRGQETDVFKRYPQPGKVFVSFSIIYLHQGSNKERSLDVICPTAADFEVWYWGIQVVRTYPPGQFSQLQGMRRPSTHQKGILGSDLSARSLDNGVGTSSSTSLKAAAATMPRAVTLGKATTALSLGHDPAVAISAAMQASQTSQSLGSLEFLRTINMGDLYVWGSLATFEDADGFIAQPQGIPCITIDPMQSWQQCRQPTLVHNTGGLNVVAAACGTRHAALISRAGELYSWGFGRGGALGHGSLVSVCAPQRVEGRWVGAHEAVQAAAASDSSTAAITSEGKLYMWGNGAAGQLGHNSTSSCTHPKLVRSLADAGLKVVQVSCGPYHTAAITLPGCLYTWGNGLFGRLGHGDTVSCYSPRQVMSLDAFTVTNVSCGWWHTAAVASPRPRPDFGLPINQSTATVGSTMSSDANGAVLVTPRDDFQQNGGSPGAGTTVNDDARDGLPSAAGDGSLMASQSFVSNESDSERWSASVAMTHSRRNLTSSADQWVDALRGGGALYTWGGDFTWMEPKDVRTLVASSMGGADVGTLESPGSQQGPPSSNSLIPSPGRTSRQQSSLGLSAADALKNGKRDHHRGCLGLGDLRGRLTPTRVGGELAHREVTQVACGWNLTIALTRDGHVFQMGGTGAISAEEEQAGHVPVWEGCRIPTQVDGALFGLYAEEVAVGMHHVAVVASRLAANGRLLEDMRRTRLLMWGPGRGGQLGAAASKDTNLPQVVAALEGRRILHIACGGNHTLCVCEHDHRSSGRAQTSSAIPSATPSPPASLINGLPGLGVTGITPRLPSHSALAPPRTSYPPPRAVPYMGSGTASMRVSHQQLTMQPLSQSSGALAGIAAALSASGGHSTSGGVTNTVTNWLSGTLGLSTSTSQSKLPAAAAAQALADARSSHDNQLNRHTSVPRDSHNGAAYGRVVAMPTMVTRRHSFKAGSSVDRTYDSVRRRRASLRQMSSNHSAAGAPGNGKAQEQEGAPLTTARTASGQLRATRRHGGLVSYASSSALSTQSSPGVVGRGGEEGVGSPTSSVSGYDGGSDGQCLAQHPSERTGVSQEGFVAGYSISANSNMISAVNASISTTSSAPTLAGTAAMLQSGSGQHLGLSRLELPDSEVNSCNVSPYASPGASGAGPTLLTCATPDFPRLPNLHLDPDAMHGPSWTLPSPQGSTSPAGYTTQPHPEPADISAFSLDARAAREATLGMWGGVPPVHVNRYGAVNDDDDSVMSPATNQRPLHTPHHSLLGRPLGRIHEMPSGELPSYNGMEFPVVGLPQAEGSLPGTFELSLQPALQHELEAAAQSFAASQQGTHAAADDLQHDGRQHDGSGGDGSEDSPPTSYTTAAGGSAMGPSPSQTSPLSMMGMARPSPISPTKHSVSTSPQAHNSPQKRFEWSEPSQQQQQQQQRMSPDKDTQQLRAFDRPSSILVPEAAANSPAGVRAAAAAAAATFQGGPSLVLAPPTPQDSNLAAQNAFLQHQIAELQRQLELAHQHTGQGSPSSPMMTPSVFNRRLSRASQHSVHSPSPLHHNSSNMPGSPHRGHGHPHGPHAVHHHNSHSSLAGTSSQHLTHDPPSGLQPSGPSIISVLSRRSIMLEEHPSSRTVGGIPIPALSARSIHGSNHNGTAGDQLQPTGTLPLPDIAGQPIDAGSGDLTAVRGRQNSSAGAISQQSYGAPEPAPDAQHHREVAVEGAPAELPAVRGPLLVTQAVSMPVAVVEVGEEEGEEDGDGPLVQLQPPFASAVIASSAAGPGPEPSAGSMSAGSSIAGVVQAVGPAMLRTKAASMLESRHRRAQSVDVSRLSLLVSSPTGSQHSSQGQGYILAPQPLTARSGRSFVHGGTQNGMWEGSPQHNHPGSPATHLARGFSTSVVPQHRISGGHGHSMGALQQYRVLSPDRHPTTGGSDGVSGGGSLPAGSPGVGDHAQHRLSMSAGGADPGSHAGAAQQVLIHPHRASSMQDPVGSFALPGMEVMDGGGHGQVSLGLSQQRPPGSVGLTQQPRQAQGEGQSVRELWPGVYVFLQPDPMTGQLEVVKVRFSRRHFTPEQATQFWAVHQPSLAAQFRININFSLSSSGGGGEPGHGRHRSGVAGVAHMGSNGGLSPLLETRESGGGEGESGGSHHNSPADTMPLNLNLVRAAMAVQQEMGVAPGHMQPHFSSGAQHAQMATGSGQSSVHQSPRKGLPPLPASPFSAPSNVVPVPAGLPPIGPRSFPVHVLGPASSGTNNSPARASTQPGSPAGFGDVSFSAGVAHHQGSYSSASGATGHARQVSMLSQPQSSTVIHEGLDSQQELEWSQALGLGGLDASRNQSPALAEDPVGSAPFIAETGSTSSRPNSGRSTVSVQARARPGHYRSRSGGPTVGGRTWG